MFQDRFAIDFSIEYNASMPSDDVFAVTISEDEYQAFLTINALPGSDVKFNDTKLKYFIKGQNVAFGVKEDILARIVSDFAAGLPIVDVLIAEGVRPQEGMPPQIELQFEMSSKPRETADGKIDYRELSKIVNVKAGQVLAIKHKMKASINGLTVTGKPVSTSKIVDVPLIAGAMVEKCDEEHSIIYRAKADGNLKYEHNVMSVFPVLDIVDDVDFTIGNIHFDGDVKIGRDILSDFIVEASGKIAVWGSAMACRLTARDHIDVRGGILGKGRGEIRSDKSIVSSFVENAKVFAGENITIKNGIMGSEAHCNGVFALETKKSRIVESTIIAAKGITACIVGSQYSSNTRLITGINIEKEQEYLATKTIMDEKIKEAREIERRYGRAMLENKNIPRSMIEKAQKDFDRWEALKEEILQVNNELKTIEELMYDYSARIIIKETLFPKVFLKIGRYEITTTHERYNVTVRYSAEENRLVF
jgi:uncharacterized protein